MGGGMSSEFSIMLEKRRLMRIKPDRKLSLKEIEAAKSDLNDAKDSLKRKKLKWATIQGYYSMFHSVRALVFSRGYREKSHHALFVALRDLFSGELERSLIRGFEDAMHLREEADYGLKFSEDGAADVMENAESFLGKAISILKTRAEES